MQFRTDRAAGSVRQLTGIAMILSLIGLSVPAAAQNALAERHGRLFPPENLGLLEGPDRAAWQKPDQIMDALGDCRRIGRGRHRRGCGMVHDSPGAARRA